MKEPIEKDSRVSVQPRSGLLVGFLFLVFFMILAILIVQNATQFMGYRSLENLLFVGSENISANELLWGRVSQGIMNFVMFAVAGFCWSKYVTGSFLGGLGLNRLPSFKMLFFSSLGIAFSLPFIESLILEAETFEKILSPGLQHLIIDMEEKAMKAQLLMLNDLSFIGVFSNILVFSIVPAFAEEVFFRGFLLQSLNKFLNGHLAVWITAFVFSFIHFQFMGFFPRFVLGAVLGYLFLLSGSLWVSIFCHFINNLLNLLFAQFVLSGAFGEWSLTEKHSYSLWVIALSFSLSLAAFYGFHYFSKKTIISNE